MLLRCLSGDTALATRAALLAALALPVENGPSGATRMRELVEAALQAMESERTQGALVAIFLGAPFLSLQGRINAC